jgi:ABC-type polysaccharide/polyol phosphate transport system ATPase subunit
VSDAIVADDITKIFRLPVDRSTTLKYRFTHWRSASRYNDLFALRGVSFSVPDGQFLGVIGRNGSGKSTLLKVLSRIYMPTSGSLSINRAVSPFLELGVGFNPELTARENVFLNGAVLGVTRKELEAHVDDIIAFAEVSRFADQKLKNFSSGMQVRLAFSVAIQADAGILLMDEVLAVGDAAFQSRCLDIFARYKREGRTVILVTHDLSAVANYCDRAILLDEGRVVGDGQPHNVVAMYQRMVGEAQEQHDEPGAQPTSERWGSGEVELTAVGIRGPDGHPHTVVRAGQAMTVSLSIEGRREMADEMVCAIGLSRLDGLEISTVDNRTDGIRIKAPHPGETTTVDWCLPVVPLREGSYALSVTITDGRLDNILSRWDSARTFRVKQESEGAGIMALTGSWSVVPGGVAQRSAAR